MEENLIGFELAKLLTHTDFPQESVNKGFMLNGSESSCYSIDYLYRTAIARPSQSLLHQWLRDNYNLMIECSHNFKGFYCKIYKIIKEDNGIPIYTSYYNSYKEALEQGLLKALTLI